MSGFFPPKTSALKIALIPKSVYYLQTLYPSLFFLFKSNLLGEDDHCREWLSYEDTGAKSPVTPVNKFCLILAAQASFKPGLKWLVFVEVHCIWQWTGKTKGPSQQVPAIRRPVGKHYVGEAVWSQHLEADFSCGTGNCSMSGVSTLFAVRFSIS